VLLFQSNGMVGEYKTILQLVTVLSHGKREFRVKTNVESANRHIIVAKRITDKAINQMEGVQNLRKAVYECVKTARKSSSLTHSLASRSRWMQRSRVLQNIKYSLTKH
jgi:hypothetical protein